MAERHRNAARVWALTICLAVSLAVGGAAGTEQSASASGTGARSLPNVREYYPDKAKRRGLTGRVGLEFSIDAKGRARNVVVVESAGKILDGGAKEMLSDMHFHIPVDWVATGGPEKRQIVGVIFELIGKPKVAPFQDNRQTMVLTGVPIK